MTRPPRGRPRSAASHEAILDATRQLLRGGYGEVTIERVAAAAGVGKQTVYRRWPAKAPMVAAAVMELFEGGGVARIPHTGDLAADLRQWSESVAALLDDDANVKVFRALAAAAATDVADGEALYDQLTGSTRATLLDRIQRARDDGHLRAEANLGSVADALIAATLYRALAYGQPGSGAAEAFAGLVDALLAGIERR